MSSTSTSGLAEALAGVARRLADERDVEATLQAIVDAAVQTVPGAQHVGVSVLDGRQVSVRKQSDPTITAVDDLQTSLQEGPCLQVLQAESRVLVTDLARDERYPRLAAAAVEHGVRSVLSYRLQLTGTTGALSFFSREPDAFTSESEVVGELFATHVGVALSGLAREQQLTEALRSRDLIGMAKGVLMVQLGLSEQDAFGTLVRLSQTENVKLADVAARVVGQAAPRS